MAQELEAKELEEMRATPNLPKAQRRVGRTRDQETERLHNEKLGRDQVGPLSRVVPLRSVAIPIVTC